MHGPESRKFFLQNLRLTEVDHRKRTGIFEKIFHMGDFFTPVDVCKEALFGETENIADVSGLQGEKSVFKI